MMVREIRHQMTGDHPPETRCFFCYARCEDQQPLYQFESHKVYHPECLVDMLVANEIESVRLQLLDGQVQTVMGYRLKHPRPF